MTGAAAAPGPRPARLHTADGLTLEGEIAAPAEPPRVAAVLCHPHPQYGGTMRSIVTAALFAALPERGIACIRFNFRGVEDSDGTHTGGQDEPLDVLAGVDAAAGAFPGLPIVVMGWSFGADMALSVADARIAGWVGIAPPLRFRAADAYAPVGHDPRPKLLILAAHDEFRAPDEIAADTAAWVNHRTEVIAGASHFFVGRTERVVDAAATFGVSLAG